MSLLRMERNLFSSRRTHRIVVDVPARVMGFLPLICLGYFKSKGMEDLVKCSARPKYERLHVGKKKIVTSAYNAALVHSYP